MSACIIMSFSRGPILQVMKLRQGGQQGGHAHTQTEQAGTVASVMADEVTRATPPTTNN